MAQQDDVFGMNDEAVNGKTPPSQKVVDWFHKRVSTSKATDFHHMIGTGPTDAASGEHDHDGKNSKRLWTEETILTDLTALSTMTQVADAVNAINAALRAKGAGA
jgi:hypothetical protein